MANWFLWFINVVRNISLLLSAFAATSILLREGYMQMKRPQIC